MSLSYKSGPSARPICWFEVPTADAMGHDRWRQNAMIITKSEIRGYSRMQQILNRRTSAPTKELITVESSQVKYTSGPGANPCNPFGPHGFMGIEDDVLGKISDWITKH